MDQRASGDGRYCCKSLFVLRIKNSAGCGCDFHVRMWGTSSPDDKLMGDLGNVIEVTQIGGRQSDRLMAEKLSPAILDFCNNIGTSRTSRDVQLEPAKWAKEDIALSLNFLAPIRSAQVPSPSG